MNLRNENTNITIIDVDTPEKLPEWVFNEVTLPIYGKGKDPDKCFVINNDRSIRYFEDIWMTNLDRDEPIPYDDDNEQYRKFFD